MSKCSTRRREVGDNVIPPNRYLHKFEFDYDQFASALKRDLPSPSKVPQKLLGAQEGDIRSFTRSLTVLGDLPGCHVRDLTSEGNLHQVCSKAAFAGRCYCISNKRLRECLNSVADPSRELEGITAGEPVRSLVSLQFDCSHN